MLEHVNDWCCKIFNICEVPFHEKENMQHRNIKNILINPSQLNLPVFGTNSITIIIRMSSKSKGPPPKLQFDDGSRIMQETSLASGSSSSMNMNMSNASITQMKSCRDRDYSTPLEQFYEIQRVSDEVIEKLDLLLESEADDSHQMKVVKIALQFPDGLLGDAADVCFRLEELLLAKLDVINTDVLVFLLGDTSTHGSCCVDEVAALHLSADIVVHYGKACLSPTKYLPVVYSFGMQQIDTKHAIQQIFDHLKCSKNSNMILLYDVVYHHAMEEVVAGLLERSRTPSGYTPMLNVILGKIPSEIEKLKTKFDEVSRSCCKSSDEVEHDKSPSCCKNTSASQQESNFRMINNSNQGILIIGGFQVNFPDNHDLGDYTILFIGGECQQLINIMMRCSGRDGAKSCWAYTPSPDGKAGILNIDAVSICKRDLNRRFFLTQKAKMAGVIGIVVGSLTNAHYTNVVKRLRRCIEDSGRVSYTFAVGKINVSKLANFGEIDCYVLVACPENSLLDSRDFHVPIVTPFELEIALGIRQWDGFYSSEFSDYLNTSDPHSSSHIVDVDSDSDSDSDNEDDRPYFSMITGTYESHRKFDDSKPQLKHQATKDTTNLNEKKSQSQIITYRSEAADFLKNREYQGLQSKVGESQVRPAIKGIQGIASDYGDR